MCAAVRTGGGGCETTEAEAGRGAGASGENVGMKVTEYSNSKYKGRTERKNKKGQILSRNGLDGKLEATNQAVCLRF